jgi:crossover junction endodeoxyribonuclease RuvC
MSANVVGIDLSLTSTGLCANQLEVITDLGNVKSTGKNTDTYDDRQKRLYRLMNEVVDWTEAKRPDLVVIEAPSYGSVGRGTFDRSGLWWMVVSALRAEGFPVAFVSPKARAKYGTGNGNSDKKAVHAFVLEKYADIAPRRIKNNDEADAVLLAAMGSRYLGHPVEPVHPGDAACAALTGVLWPTL